MIALTNIKIIKIVKWLQLNEVFIQIQHVLTIRARNYFIILCICDIQESRCLICPPSFFIQFIITITNNA
jgi:hypothetical protein